MKAVKGFISRSGEVQDLMKFLWKAKMWFLIPFVITLILFGALLVFAQSTGIAPFVYTLI